MKYYLYDVVGGTITKEYEVGADIFFTYINAKNFTETGEWLPIGDGSKEWCLEFYKGNECIAHMVDLRENIWHDNEPCADDIFDKKRRMIE